MDITLLFKACVKTVKARNKAVGIQSPTSDAKRILKTKQKNVFVVTAKNITAQITKLRDFLMEHRDGYLSFFNSIGGQSMTDEERDEIDVAAQRSINSCTHLIKEFRNDNRKQIASAQMQEFMKAVTELVEAYLKSVCKIYTEIKSLRIKKALDVRKLSKLEMARPILVSPPTSSVEMARPILVSPPTSSVPQPIAEVIKEKDEEIADSWLQRQESENEVAVIDDNLSSEELQMFESENVQLLNDLNSMTEEVQQIESKVMHIAELQEIFSEKVLQQEQDIDRIANTVVGATENVKDANDQIKQAIQRNAGLRVYILFFLLVMSFTLLFLDWYND